MIEGEYRLRADALKVPGPAVRYHRHTVYEIDRTVISHLHEYGKITNRTLQNLFDIDVYRSRDILADLQRRELIVRTSEATRGPTVEYGPGPKLPKSRRRRGNPLEILKTRATHLCSDPPASSRRAAASAKAQLEPVSATVGGHEILRVDGHGSARWRSREPRGGGHRICAAS